MSIIDALQEPWAMRALMASVMVGLMLGLLGAFIVLRNMSLVGDALAHSILPGVVLAFILVGVQPLSIFTGAVVAGLTCAFAITWIQKNGNTKNDAAIGIVYTTMFSIGVMGISAISSKDGVHIDLKDFLIGNILGVSTADLQLTFVILLVITAGVILFYRYLFISTFQESMARVMGINVNLVHYFLMLLLSFAVVASLRTVGIILVVAMLITPASTALLLSNNLRKVVAISALLGMIAAIGGLLLAIAFNTTPGPAMAVLSAVIYFATVLFAPQKGLTAKYLNKKKMKARILNEDILKHVLKSNGQATIASATKVLDESPRLLKKLTTQLKQATLLHESNGMLSLSVEGEGKANRLLRAHRLWETYLVDKIGMTENQIHLEAEDLEHHLTEDILDQVDEILGYPDTDPHGSPIPPKESKLGLVAYDLSLKTNAIIKAKQQRGMVMQFLWENNVAPDMKIILKAKGQHVYEIECDNGQVIEVPISIAKSLQVEET